MTSALQNAFETFETLNYGDFHVKRCPKTQMLAIIAIHHAARGPALGGCRCVPYPSFESALTDALHLARGMSYKAAISNLPHGGGKAVIIAPPKIPDRKSFFKAFGTFVHELGGRYITAEDSGVFVEDMDTVKESTPYVTGFSNPNYQHHDPSPVTALGVCSGIEAAVFHQLKKENLNGVHVAVQGIGKVGFHLCRLLAERGAKLTIADVNPKAIQSFLESCEAKVVHVDEIHKVPCDVYAPCALSFAINKTTLSQLNTQIIAGSANNQLAQPAYGDTLWERGILYAPDYAINAGGLILVSAQYAQSPEKEALEQVKNIYGTLMNIFEEAQQTNVPPHRIADNIAASKLTSTIEPLQMRCSGR